MSLKDYKKKRDFKKTTEPQGTVSHDHEQDHLFVIQKGFFLKTENEQNQYRVIIQKNYFLILSTRMQQKVNLQNLPLLFTFHM